MENEFWKKRKEDKWMREEFGRQIDKALAETHADMEQLEREQGRERQERNKVFVGVTTQEKDAEINGRLEAGLLAG